MTNNLMNTENLTLTHGPHDTSEEGTCLREAVDFMAGENHTDHPACSCPVIAEFARTINDWMGKGAEGDALRAKYLLPLSAKLVGTRSTPEVERKRAFYFADQAVRLFAPKALEAAGLTKEADALRALPEIVDEHTASASASAAWSASSAADAAYAAAVWSASAAHAFRASAAARVARASARAADAADAAWSASAAARAARVADAAWEQAAQVLAEACEINLEGGE